MPAFSIISPFHTPHYAFKHHEESFKEQFRERLLTVMWLFDINLVYWSSRSETWTEWLPASWIHLINSLAWLTRKSCIARMKTPRMMRVPPVEVIISGMDLVMRHWTENASTSSRHLRLATRLGEINWRDRVRVVNAIIPDTDKPAWIAFQAVRFEENILTNKSVPLHPCSVIYLMREYIGWSFCQTVDDRHENTRDCWPWDQDITWHMFTCWHKHIHAPSRQAGNHCQQNTSIVWFKVSVIHMVWGSKE